MDQQYMSMALELAKKGMGHTSPNPMVGCVIVKNGRVTGQGYHEQYGKLHAERNAFKNCIEDPEESTLYVTLEPCCHHGKTPPCTDAIIENKVKKVVVGAVDDNPLVGGKGVRILKDHGIEVVTGVMEEESRKLNEVFFHYIKTGTPFVAMKYAMTLDGKIAAANGDSKWITAKKAREHVHELRNKYKGIMIGSGTLLADDPMLNCRLEGGADPVRIICDTNLKVDVNSNIVKTAAEIPTYFAHCSGAEEKIGQLESKGIKLIHCPGETSVDLEYLMKELGQRKVDSILLEGGGILNGQMLEKGLVQKVYSYIAPKLVGGGTNSPISGTGAEYMDQAFELKNTTIHQKGKDFLIEGYL